MLSMSGDLDYALSKLKNASKSVTGDGAGTGAGTGAQPPGKTTGGPLPYKSYVGGDVAYTPLTRMAQSQVTFTQPSFYSPLHTPQNWQIPSKRREIYQWMFVKPCEVISYDYTFKLIDDLVFNRSRPIEDTITGDVMYDDIDGEEILSGSGIFRMPCRFSQRECVNKEAIEFRCWGYWRSLYVTADHLQVFLDGKKYRHKVKLSKHAEYRRRKGVPENGPKHPDNFAECVTKKLACEVGLEDYLLFPTPEVGNTRLLTDDAWVIGNCIADGDSNARQAKITTDKDELHVGEVAEIFRKNFDMGTVAAHASSEQAVCIRSGKKAADFFARHIVGKYTEKKFTDAIRTWDEETRLHVIGGYFDGDGSFNDDLKLVANNYSKDMADQLYAMILSVGIRCSLIRVPLCDNTYPTESEWCYRLMIPSSDVPRLAKYMRSDKVPADFEPKPTRNLRFFYEENGVRYLAQPIRYIKRFKYNGQGFDMQVDPERAFVANGFVSSNCRYFYENEPKVAAAIDFYSSFPLAGFETQCKFSEVKRFYDNLNKKLDLDYWVKMISKEYFLLGDCFPFLDIQCDVCGGSGLDPDTGEECRHPGGTFHKLVTLNPDWIDVQSNPFGGDSIITLMPTDELKRVVWTKSPRTVYDRLPEHIKHLIATGRPIPLANESASHLKHNPYGNSTYGTSLIRRLFKILAYKDKLMTAQWLVAERLIIPVRIVKVGSEERPAGPADIADVQQQLAQIANDPNLTLVTHHNFDYDWVGTNGKVLQLSNEYELIDKEILQGLMINEALLSGQMAGYQCHDEQTRVLTKAGLKHYEEVTPDDELACFNSETEEIEYHKYLGRHLYDFDGDLVHFQTDRVDVAVTPNHKMLFKGRNGGDWLVGPASLVKNRARFRKNAKWRGNPDHPRNVEVGNGEEIPLLDYLEIGAFYVTEGYVRRETRKARSTFGDPMAAVIYQTPKGKAWDTLCDLKLRSDVKIALYRDDRFCLHKKTLAMRLANEFGTHSHSKKVPAWIKDLPRDLLEKFLKDMVDGDGSLRKRDKHGPRKYYTYVTTSERLAQDVMEMALKCGYYPRLKFVEGKKYWRVAFSDYDRDGNDLPLRSSKYQAIGRMPYKGKVWCFTTPTGFFVTERNGLLAIQGNSAAIGAETMIQRLESWRNDLARWIENKIYLPIAQMRGFVDEEESKEVGETVYIYPKIKWNDLNIRDDTQQKQLLLQLHDKQVLSTQSLCEKFDLDYDQEVERVRMEMGAAALSQMAGGGEGGGGMGGAPPMGGGDMSGMFGGGAGGGMEFGGAEPMPGEAPPPPPGAPGAPAPGGAAAANLGGTPGKVLAPGRKGKKQEMDVPEGKEVQPFTKLTSLEQIMFKILDPMDVPFKKYMQYTVLGKYPLDFAIPAIKLGIECDGDKWHEGMDAKARDKKRDMTIAQHGWTVVRFRERELKERANEVAKTVAGHIYRLWRKALDRQKQDQESLSAKGAAMESLREAYGVTESDPPNGKADSGPGD